MAGAGVELATAWVRLVPSMEGATGSIVKSLAPATAAAEREGEKAGKGLGGGLGKGVSAKSAAIIGAVGGVVASAANTAISAVSNLFSDAIKASDATDKFVQTLSFAGLKPKGIQQAKKEARKYADDTVYDLTTIQNTTAQLAANGVKDYIGLTKAAGNLNAVAGGNSDTYKSVAMALTQTAGAGKLTTENWNQLANAIPGASGRMQEAMKKNGAYTGNFRDAMAAGEISADEFNKALLQLGSEPVAVEAATSVSTMEGSVGNLAASITGRLSDAISAIKPVLTPLISGFADFISNTKVFVPVVAGLATALLVALAPAIWGAVTATIAWTAALLANPMTWVVLAIAALVAGIVALAMNWDAVVKWVTEVWGGFLSWATGVIDGFVGWWNGIWGAVGTFFTDLWSGFVNWVMGVWKGFITWGMSVTQAFSSWWNGLWSGIGDFFSNLWTGIVTAVRIAIGAVSSVVRKVVGGISSWWRGMWSGIGDFFSGIWDGIVNAVKGFGRFFRDAFNGIKGFVKSAFSGVIGVVKAPINGLIGLINGAIGGLNSLSVSIPDWVPFVGGQTWGLSIPTIPMLADGATILPRRGGTLAVLAEAGKPESVVDTGLLNRALEEGLDGNRAGMVVQGPLVQVDQMVVDSEQRVDEVSKALYERAQRAARAGGGINLGGAVTA